MQYMKNYERVEGPENRRPNQIQIYLRYMFIIKNYKEKIIVKFD